MVILFYKFTSIADPEAFRIEQRALCSALNLKGRMLIAPEGINATFEGKIRDIKAYQQKLLQNKQFSDLIFKESVGTGSAFTNLEIKVRDEVVTLGVGELNVTQNTAPKISAAQLQNWFERDEDFVILDLRNEFEIAAGHFTGSVSPKLRNFRDLPSQLNEISHLKNQKVLTVCTGGVRCEKATPYLKKQGFTDLYQLEDGIHTYMAKYPGDKFKGTLFVFDNRMTTPVVDYPNREVVGKCAYCQTPSEDFYNDDSSRPSRKVICCTGCIPQHTSDLRSVNI